MACLRTSHSSRLLSKSSPTEVPRFRIRLEVRGTCLTMGTMVLHNMGLIIISAMVISVLGLVVQLFHELLRVLYSSRLSLIFVTLIIPREILAQQSTQVQRRRQFLTQLNNNSRQFLREIPPILTVARITSTILVIICSMLII